MTKTWFMRSWITLGRQFIYYCDTLKTFWVDIVSISYYWRYSTSYNNRLETFTQVNTFFN